MNKQGGNRQAITLAITGASGAPYAMRLLELLLKADKQVHLLKSKAANIVMNTELDMKLPSASDKFQKQLSEYFSAQAGQLQVWDKEQWDSPVASGSAAPKQMVICPCSTGTLAAVAHGMSDNLIERAADVVIKERGQLILVPRETPFSAIHLENMLKLSQLGAIILPAAPGFYHKPKSIDNLIDFVVARILDQLGIEQDVAPKWGYGNERK